jgi:hypothetical protein
MRRRQATSVNQVTIVAGATVRDAVNSATVHDIVIKIRARSAGEVVLSVQAGQMDGGMHFTRHPTMCRCGLLALLFLAGASILSNSTDAQEAALPPDDSEYIIFVIDTSGSMFSHVWPMVLQKVEETLSLYTKVEGFQVMNDEGAYMFTGDRGRWLSDTPAQRRTVVERLRTWNAFSNSSPIEGIVEAIRTYHDTDKKIGLYVFGDEFTGPSIDSVVKSVDIINREDETGARRVRIHAIGFPLRRDAPQYTSIQFTTLMRILCQRNGGTFVSVDEPERSRGR